MKGLGAELTLLAMNTKKHYYHLEDNHVPFDQYEEIVTIDIDNTIRLKDAFLNLFSTQSFHISRFISKEFEQALIKLLKRTDFDVVQLETLYLAPYIPVIRKYSNARISMRAHNVESEIWERITNNTKSLPKKMYLKYLAEKLHRFEKRMLHQYDILMPITRRDLDIFKQMGFKGKSVVVPIGLDSSEYKADFDSYQKNLSISFIGSLDWMPNIEGLKWFLKHTWGKMQKELPGIQLHIAGRNTPDWLKNIKKKNIIVHGEVEDASDFINDHSIMVVPLLSGSGMRAKILEGMALGKVVLTTSIGLEGIDATHKKEILIGDAPADMIKAVKWCSNQNGRLEKIGRRACDFVQSNYDSIEIARKVIKAYSSTTVEIV
ncbi:MAG: glycosyltransferase [Bacteroidetes bacterium]|nr:MAG: glycosyltransferase [Bacteroidota bacterium]